MDWSARTRGGGANCFWRDDAGERGALKWIWGGENPRGRNGN